MSQHAHKINRLLATMNEQGDEDNNTLLDEEARDTFHVYPVEGVGLLLTRDPLAPEEAALPIVDSQNDHTNTAAAQPLPPLFVVFLLLLCVFVLGDLVDTQLIALMTPTVTVTIVPQTQTVLAIADLPAAAIHAHAFAPLTVSLSQTVPATGTGHQDARQAVGTVTFYNGLFTQQVIAQGTVLTGRDGVKIATTQPATIPPGDPTSGYGTVTVPVQAVQTGAAGNIAAGDIAITITNGLLVKNGQLSGGQDARTFSVVTKEDRTRAVTHLTPSVLQSEQAALTSQLQANEALFSPTCTPATTTDHQPGEEATHLTVTVAETCRAQAYNQHALQAHGEQLLNAKAYMLDKGYRLVGNIHPTFLSPQETARIWVQFSGAYVSQINPHELTTLIAGQPKHRALLLLSRITGIHHATIAGITDDTPIPLDTTHIHFMLVSTVA